MQNSSMSSQEQPEDRQPEDQPEAAETETTQDAVPADGAAMDDAAPDAAEGDGDDAPPTEDERIEAITERIDKARAQAEEAGVLVDTDEARYADSGATEDDDDQTITPPG